METTRKTVFCGTQKEIAEKIAVWRWGKEANRKTVSVMLDYIKIQRGYREYTKKALVFGIPGTDIMVDVTPRKMACWRV